MNNLSSEDPKFLYPARFDGDGERKRTTAVVLPAIQENMATRVGVLTVFASLLQRLAHERTNTSEDNGPLIVADEAVQSMLDKFKSTVAVQIALGGLAKTRLLQSKW